MLVTSRNSQTVRACSSYKSAKVSVSLRKLRTTKLCSSQTSNNAGVKLKRFTPVRRYKSCRFNKATVLSKKLNLFNGFHSQHYGGHGKSKRNLTVLFSASFSNTLCRLRQFDKADVSSWSSKPYMLHRYRQFFAVGFHRLTKFAPSTPSDSLASTNGLYSSTRFTPKTSSNSHSKHYLCSAL